MGDAVAGVNIFGNQLGLYPGQFGGVGRRVLEQIDLLPQCCFKLGECDIA